MQQTFQYFYQVLNKPAELKDIEVGTLIPILPPDTKYQWELVNFTECAYSLALTWRRRTTDKDVEE